MNASAVKAELINLSIDLPVIKIMKGKQHWFDICLLDTTYLELKDANANIKKEFNFYFYFWNFWNFYFNVFDLDLIFRLAVQCVWIAWRTWSSCAAMAHVRCVATGWRSAPYVGRRWKSGSFCISDSGKVDPSEEVIMEKRIHLK